MIRELSELRDRERVFRDRAHAGLGLAGMLDAARGSNALVLAIPVGGIPVAAEIARQLELDIDVIVVSKITLPWNPEAGYGAVAEGGKVRLNDSIVESAGLSAEEVEYGIERTRARVERRIRLFRGERPFPAVERRPIYVVDDGLASGFTVSLAIEALRARGGSEIHIAVPTAPYSSARDIETEVASLVCPNLRTGWSFAVASAYERWYDEDEERVAEILQTLARERASRGQPRHEPRTESPAGPVRER